jgi:acetyl esterase
VRRDERIVPADVHRPSAQARAVLAERAAAGGRPMREAPVAESRAAQWEWQPYMDDTIEVASVQDRFIPGPTAEIPVRIYFPHGTGPFPALVTFHGGCWIVGNIELADPPHRALAAATGCVVVAVNYQKAPEHRFPIPLDDCYAGYRWAMEHAAELNLDASRIGVAGDSAGGNLAAAVCLKARAAREPLPAIQVLIYPATDWRLDTASARRYADGFGLSAADMAWAWRHYVSDESQLLDPLVSPVRDPDPTGLPPAVVVVAEFDVLHDEGLAYARRLAAADIPTIILEYEGAIHGVLWMGAAVEVCAEMLRDVGAALDRLWAPATG